MHSTGHINIFMAISGRKLECRDIVDGHRQKTLQLLWTLIFVFKVITVVALVLSDIVDLH